MLPARRMLQLLNETESPEEFHAGLLEAVRAPLGAHTACLKLIRNDRVVSEYGAGSSQGALNSAYATLEGAIKRKVSEGRVFRLAEYDYLDEQSREGGRMELMVRPLEAGGALMGLLILGLTPGAEPDADPDFLSGLMALCIDSFHRAQLTMEARNKLQALEKMRVDFITSISHALRTPLTTIKGLFSAASPDAELDHETRRRHHAILTEQIEILSQFVDDLAALMEIEQGHKIEINIAEVDAVKLVSDLVDMKRRVSDRYEYKTVFEPGSIKVPADKEKLLRILAKLLDNAEKHSDRGDRILVEAVEGPGDVSIIVQDWGRGMERSEVNRVFARFYRPPESAGPDRGGVGVSLYLAKKIIEAHGGIIWIDSNPGQGAKVTITLPKTIPNGV